METSRDGVRDSEEGDGMQMSMLDSMQLSTTECLQ